MNESMNGEDDGRRPWNIKVHGDVIQLAQRYVSRERKRRGKDDYHSRDLVEVALPQWIQEHDPLPNETSQSPDDLNALAQRLRDALAVIEGAVQSAAARKTDKVAIRKKPPPT